MSAPSMLRATSRHQSALELVEQYLSANRVPPSRFGRMAVNDPRFVDDLRRGREPRPKTLRRLRAFIRRATGGQ